MSGSIGKRRDAPGSRALIEDNLRKVYQEKLEEEVPDRLKSLLEQLRQAQKEAGK